MRVPLISDAIDGIVGTAQWLGHTFVGTPFNFVKDTLGIGGAGFGGAVEGGQMGVKWGILGGLAFGAFKASQENKDIVGGALEGALTGATTLGAAGAGIGALASAAPAALETVRHLASNVSETASGLFPSGGGKAGAQNLPSKPPAPSSKSVG